ncbi:MAG: Fe3+/spermidine/putrescine ABC transporter ATP-binding protein [Cereibacter sphaeroides]|uniref:Spermidine/putrescine import ATP-binding protein PotA n=1 Tax=Cereibacter sphaeroides TaxID=1063 RepID=A0A2W5SKP7_CERSP|nr:MAG: Fe3+/spermidine/putrescine ABC transporter ATP-binding protein [Cereibacter sphaeroides]
MTDAPIISIKGVTKSFGTYAALRGITFDIAKGEFFSLLGASGCGKTTLLRILAGIEEPSTGELLIDGQSMKGIPPNRRPTNMVFQSYAIFPHLSVRENVGYGLVYQNISKADAKVRTDQAIEMVKLGGLGDRGAGQLSGGQRQRVALARALVLRPKVLLLDEPLSALDKKLREEMQLELRELQRSVGITFVFVTHDQEEALTLSDRIAVMSTGKVLQIDTPDGLYQRPNSREVAEFIGTMNLLPATVSSLAGGAVTLDGGALGRWQAQAGDQPLSQGQKVSLALRPEKLRLAAATAGGTGIPGRLRSVAYLGDRSHYIVGVDGLEAPLTVFRSNAGGDTAPLHEGDAVQLSWDPAAALVLAG